MVKGERSVDLKTVCIIGEGAWGTAVATLLVQNGYTVKLWCHDPNVADAISKKRENNRYLPGILLDEKIQPTTDLTQATCDVRWVFEAIPVTFLRPVLQEAKACFSPDQVWVVLSKGIEQETLLLPTQMIDEIFGPDTQKAVFAGPSFAQEVATKQITAVSIAATDCDIGLQLQGILANDYFRPYITTDMIGVQVGAALKNIITLGIGLLDGAGYNDNAKAFFLTRGLHEMAQCAQALGGKQETIYGLSGVGDLVLTSMGKLSRNLAIGRQLGKGQILDEILQETGYISEGINSVKSVCQLGKKLSLDLFICNSIYHIIFEQQSIATMFEKLMQRPFEWECKI